MRALIQQPHTTIAGQILSLLLSGKSRSTWPRMRWSRRFGVGPLPGSDLLAIFLMKGLRPEKFREKVFISTAQLDKLIERELATLRGEEERQSSEVVN